jgi:hypothetical protein
MESPSIFGSALKAIFSCSANALSSESIGSAWRTFLNLPVGAAPTRRDGESARTSAGKRFSIAALRSRSAS